MVLDLLRIFDVVDGAKYSSTKVLHGISPSHHVLHALAGYHVCYISIEGKFSELLHVLIPSAFKPLNKRVVSAAGEETLLGIIDVRNLEDESPRTGSDEVPVPLHEQKIEVSDLCEENGLGQLDLDVNVLFGLGEVILLLC
jgi:hypothetical protein